MGYLFFSSGGDLARIKTQIYELLILISRAAIDAGASPEATLAANHQYLQGINSLQDFDGLCLWFTKAVGALMDSVFDCAGGPAHQRDSPDGAVPEHPLQREDHHGEDGPAGLSVSPLLQPDL